MRLDHLLYVGPDLDALKRELHLRAGLLPTAGGTHPGQGTHNALLGLGPDSYLELMAPDPAQRAAAAPRAAHEAATADPDTPRVTPPGTFLRSIAYAASPQVFTWCAKVRDAASFATAARSLGLDVTVFPGARSTPTGATLRWDLIVVDGHGLGGVVPFFIDWRDSPHPARTLHADKAGRGLALVGLELRHADATALASLLAALGAASGSRATTAHRVTVGDGSGPSLVATFIGPAGSFELSGAGGRLVTDAS